MNEQPISLSEETLNHLFPFYIIVNNRCEIECAGITLKKIIPLQSNTLFTSIFQLKRPYFPIHNFDDLLALQRQLLFIEYIPDSKILLRGQFEKLEGNDTLIFAGSPWFNSMDEVREKKLTLSDFAIHDPMMDLLHVVKTAEMASNDLKQLVKTIDKQKKELKLAAQEINNIALFPKQNPDPMIRINHEGKVLLQNPAADKITHLKYNQITYPDQEVWKVIAKQINPLDARSSFEVEYEQKTYSFVAIPIQEQNYYNIYGREITNEKKSKEILTRREEKYRSIISNINLGLLEVDLDENILFVNQSFCKISGYTHQELIGQNAQKLFTVGDAKGVLIGKIADRKERISDAYELEVIDKFGQTKYWLISGAPQFNDAGEQTGSIGIHLDITERKEQERKMEELLVTLQKVNNELNDFAYVVSHDLKAPLRAIGSLATWLQADYADKLDDEGKLTLQLMVQRTQRMHNLIDGILNYSKIGTEKHSLALVKTNELVLKIADMISIPAHITLSLVNKLPDVMYEEIKLQQVFQNLMSNAIKFIDKPQGHLWIESKDKGSTIEFSVRDNGPGIEEIYHKKIFQMFQTLQSRDEFESTGVGLSIVKKIVEGFGGKISVESKVGIGTIFTFSVLK